MRLREVSSITEMASFLAAIRAAVPSGNSPSSTMPSTFAASARSTSPPSPPGVITASATTPRACAAATNSGVGDLNRRQLTGVPASSSSERVSAHGHRTGTQEEGGGAARHRKGTKLMAATQRPARIHIELEYDIRRTAEVRSPARGRGRAVPELYRNCTCKRGWPTGPCHNGDERLSCVLFRSCWHYGFQRRPKLRLRSIWSSWKARARRTISGSAPRASP